MQTLESYAQPCVNRSWIELCVSGLTPLKLSHSEGPQTQLRTPTPFFYFFFLPLLRVVLSFFIALPATQGLSEVAVERGLYAESSCPLFLKVDTAKEKLRCFHRTRGKICRSLCCTLFFAVLMHAFL